MRWIYLSPHFDDAALCAGGLIYDQYQAGEVVEIWTVMSGIPSENELTPYARVMHERWSTGTAAQTVELRRAEDHRAAAILGARLIQLGFLDAIYRTTPDGAALYDDPVGASVHAQDAELVRDIARRLKRRLRGDEMVISLLGIGDHADHVIVRGAAEAAGCQLQYVADFPYVINFPETMAPKVAGLKSQGRRVSESGVRVWIEAVEAYASQLGSVFGESSAAEIIRRYWEPLEGIEVWGQLHPHPLPPP
jgi:LmbE family N-acetylglucosaminyl deacetylase